MPSLGAGDYRRLLDLVAEMLQHVSPGFPDTDVTGTLRDAFHAEFTGAARVDLVGTNSRTWGDSPQQILAPGTDFHQYAASHPVADAFRMDTRPRPIRASDLPGGSPAYGTIDMSHLLVIPMAVTIREICAVALRRDETDFTDWDVEMAGGLRPVLSAVYALRGRLAPADPDACDADTGIALTPRELAVLDLMADGLIAPAIARRLGISPRTVSRHIENIYRKLDTHDRASTILRAQNRGCLPHFRNTV
jgi:DNA-binding CsgD family transcriptional regulator